MSDKTFDYKVSWSDEDECFVGTCKNFPGLSHLDSNEAAALDGIRSLVSFVLDKEYFSIGLGNAKKA